MMRAKRPTIGSEDLRPLHAWHPHYRAQAQLAQRVAQERPIHAGDVVRYTRGRRSIIAPVLAAHYGPAGGSLVTDEQLFVSGARYHDLHHVAAERAELVQRGAFTPPPAREYSPGLARSLGITASPGRSPTR